MLSSVCNGQISVLRALSPRHPVLPAAPRSQPGYAVAPTTRQALGQRGSLQRVISYQAEGAAPAAKAPAAGSGRAVVASSWPCKGGSLVRLCWTCLVCQKPVTF